jgi:hypothetical protein
MVDARDAGDPAAGRARAPAGALIVAVARAASDTSIVVLGLAWCVA